MLINKYRSSCFVAYSITVLPFGLWNFDALYVLWTICWELGPFSLQLGVSYTDDYYNKLTFSTLMLVTNWYAVTVMNIMIACSRACV